MISNIEIKGLENLKINTDLPLKEIANSIADDITLNLNQSTGLDGSSLKPLSDKYKKLKQKYYGHTNIFWGKEGLLRKAVKVFKINKDEYHIKLNSNRADIGLYHNEGMGKNPKREFFGVSKRVLNSLGKLIDKWQIKN